MTDPDERAINRAIAYVGWDAKNTNAEDELQDVREEARAALHRVFRKTRKLEDEIEQWRKETQFKENERIKLREENARLREENENVMEEWDAMRRRSNENAAENARLREIQKQDMLGVLELRAELARLREALETIIELVRRRDDAPDTVPPSISVAIESLARDALKENDEFHLFDVMEHKREWHE